MVVILSGSDEPTHYVECMVRELKLMLTPAQYAGYLASARFVAKADRTPLDIPKLHEMMLGAGGRGGVYRTSCVLDCATGRVKKFPRATAIAQLMYSVRTAYKGALNPNTLGLDQRQHEGMLWMIAASGRCLHPFEVGNTRLFCLVENHLRQTHGIPWRMGLCLQDQFRAFRQRYELKHHDCYNEIPGT